VLSNPLTELETTLHTLVDTRENQGREEANFLISSSSVAVVGKENLPTKSLLFGNSSLSINRWLLLMEHCSLQECCTKS